MGIIFLNGNAIKWHLRTRGFNVTGARQRERNGKYCVNLRVYDLHCPIEEFLDAAVELVRARGPYGAFWIEAITDKGTAIRTGFRGRPPMAVDNDVEGVPF
jgi:hypothetical protein